jgi:hypothetical protein
MSMYMLWTNKSFDQTAECFQHSAETVLSYVNWAHYCHSLYYLLSILNQCITRHFHCALSAVTSCCFCNQYMLLPNLYTQPAPNVLDNAKFLPYLTTALELLMEYRLTSALVRQCGHISTTTKEGLATSGIMPEVKICRFPMGNFT